MNRLTKLASNLYPRWWRERYGEEFAALLEDAKPGFRGTLDILKGALTLQLSTFSTLKAILVCAVVGVVGGIATTYFLTPQYSSQAVLTLSAPEGRTEREVADTINEYSHTILTRNELSSLVRTLGLYPIERTRMTIEDLLNLMRDNIRITPGATVVGGRAVPAFGIEFQYADRTAANKVVTILAANYLGQNFNASGELKEIKMELGRPASMPTDPVFPRRKNFAVAGLGAGLVLGSGTALILRLRRKREPA